MKGHLLPILRYRFKIQRVTKTDSRKEVNSFSINVSENGVKSGRLRKMSENALNLILSESLGEMPPDLIKWIEETTVFITA